MDKKQFDIESKKSIQYINKCIFAVNELVRKNDPIRFFNDRLKLLIAGCKRVMEGQAVYLDFAVHNPNQAIDEVIKYDYTISFFANRLYIGLENLLEYYFQNRKVLNMDYLDPKTLVDANNLKNEMMYIAARWYTERQMNVWDHDKPFNKQKLPQRLPLLHDVMPCFDRILAVKMGIKYKDGFNPKRLVVCVPPSSGKTYEANIYTDLMLAHHMIRYAETGIIRMTNNAENAYNYGSQVYKMMTDSKFCKIFPELSIYKTAGGKNKMFLYESREKYLLKDCNPECSDSMFLFGRDAGINGKRSLLGAIIDDLSDGQTTMDNDDIHKKTTDKVMTDVMDRSDDDDCPIIIMGTMYNENDIQNAFIQMWEKKGLIQHPDLKNVRYTPDGKCAVCLVDIEDENGHSIAPLLYTDEKLQEKKDYLISTGKPYVYNLIYRQKRDSREPKTFSDDTLMHYRWGELPESLDKYCLSIMDLTRKNGNDYFANPYLRYNPENGLYYLTDAIFEQKSLGLVNDPKNEFRDKVCNKIYTTNTTELCIENNTSNTTGTLLKERCKELGYKNCKIRERYTSKQYGVGGKVQRILNMEETIKNYIVFPQKDTIPTGHPLYQFMEQLNNWNSKDTSRNNHDDAPDVLAMFSEEFIFKKVRVSVVRGVDKSAIFG